MSLQEKFEVMLPAAPKEDDGKAGVDFKAARNTGQTGRLHRNNTTSAEDVGGKFNFHSPGTDIGDQERSTQNQMPLSMAGATDVSDHVNPETFKMGFKRHPMAGCSDEYSGEHIDLFYGEAIGDDGNEGFCERNNYLDRM